MTHAVGVWPTLEALRHRPGAVRRVVCHPRLPPRDRAEVVAAAAAAEVPLIEDADRVRDLRRHGAAWVVTELEPDDDALRTDLDHLVLVRAAQAGNVGAAMRAALGFGVRDVALIEPLAALAPPPLAAWTFGPEGGGLPPEVHDGAVAVTIPQDRAPESHNLAVAVGVALYARAAAPPGGTA